jgi:hypothetical protein
MLLGGLRLFFPVGFLHHRLLECIGQRLVLLVQVFDFQAFLMRGLFSGRRRRSNDDDNGGNDRDRLEQEQAVVCEKFCHGFSRISGNGERHQTAMPTLFFCSTWSAR